MTGDAYVVITIDIEYSISMVITAVVGTRVRASARSLSPWLSRTVTDSSLADHPRLLFTEDDIVAATNAELA